MNGFISRCRPLFLCILLPLSALAQPPFSGTAFVDRNILIPSDPSVFNEVIFKGNGVRTVFDRRTNAFGAINVYVFEATGTDGSALEAHINLEFGSVDSARAEALRYARVVGQLPIAARRNVKSFVVHRGDHDFGGNRNGTLLIHTGRTPSYEALGVLEEIMVHEAVHASLDERHEIAPAWIAAQVADGEFISTYARDNPVREDVAESYLTYLAVRDSTGRVSRELKGKISAAIPHRISYFDVERVLDWAERTHPEWFASSGQSTQSLDIFRYRGYSGGHFLGVQQGSPARLIYLGPLSSNRILDLGLLSDWVTLAAP